MIKLPFWVFRSLYWYIDKLDKDHRLTLMNFGYYDKDNSINLESCDEYNRYPLQLYHHIAEMADLAGRDVVEVGSGRGGGLDYISRRFKPGSSTGIDIEKSAVAFSNKMFGNARLKYIAGNAQALPLSDEYCDVVINVESSHRYTSMKTFVSEVRRVLRTGGYFLITDFRRRHDWPETMDILLNSGFKVKAEKDITQNVLEALARDTERRMNLVRSYVPRLLYGNILNWSGASGTATYEHFLNRKFIYRSLVLQKED